MGCGLCLWCRQARVKNQVSQQYGVRRTPKLVEIIAAIPEAFRPALQSILTAKPIRTASGVCGRLHCKPLLPVFDRSAAD